MSNVAATGEFSVLRGCRLRPLHEAIAQHIAGTEPGDPLWPALLRLYKALPTEQRTRCKAALVAFHG